MRRRDFLKALATATAVAATGPIMSACSNTSDSSHSSSQGDSSGSTIRIAAIGAAGEEPNLEGAVSTATWAAVFALYENLVTIDDEGIVYQLAESIESNDDATEWTISIRKDAAFSDGSPVTAQDVHASLSTIANNPMHGQSYADVDLEKSSANDDSTVVVALKRPRADFLETVLGTNSLVFKGGDPRSLGSGPFVIDSGDSATGWTFSANEHFPEKLRVADTLEIQVISDADARLRAVDSGAVDLALDLPATATRSLTQAEAWVPGSFDSKGLVFILNTNVAPFDDPEVRRAMQIALDRQAMIDAALDGTGSIGADVPGLGFSDYPDSISDITRDVDTAKKIFAEKNITELTLVTADFSPGMNAGADVAAQQLKELGVNVTVDKRDPSTYFSDMEALSALPFFASYFVNRPMQSGIPFITGSNGMFNLSGYGANPDWDGKITAAQAETDESKREEMFTELAKEMQDGGGNLIWGYADEIHGRSKGTPDVRIQLATPVLVKK